MLPIEFMSDSFNIDSLATKAIQRLDTCHNGEVGGGGGGGARGEWEEEGRRLIIVKQFH